MNKGNLASRLGRWSAAHRKAAVLGWIAFVVLSLALGSAAGVVKLKEEDTGNGASRAAAQTIAHAGLKSHATEQVLISARGGLRVSDPAFRGAVADVLGRVRRAPHVTSVTSPYQPGHAGQIAYGGHAALVIFQLRGTHDQVQKRVDPLLGQVAAAQRAHPALRIEEVGDASTAKAIQRAFAKDFQKAETLSVPITLAILLIAFGSLVAAGLPVMLGLSAVAAAMGLAGIFSHLSPVTDYTSSVILLIGLAVGVDYSLFYIRREREERDRGRTPADALQAAAATSGRAVMISGSTVIVAMAGMYITGNSVFTGFGTGTILVVACAVIGSVTVLPALLSKLGDKVDKGRVPFVRRRRDRASGAWVWVVEHALRHPVAAVLASGGLLVALAIPALSIHTVDTGIQGLPPKLPITHTLKRLERTFPGGPQPALVVVRAKDVSSPPVARGLAQIGYGALGTGLMHEPIQTRVNASRSVAVVSVPLAGSGTDATSDRALAALRDRVVPNTIGKVPGTTVNVGGQTAGSKDFNDRMKARAPYVFAFVLGLAFCLLLVTFRSIVIAAKAIVLNMLSVAAAYGILVWIFQNGHLQGLLDFQSIGGITIWLPLFLFVVLFGLSMDYHVLILSRIREAYDSGLSTERAVAKGIGATAGVVTSAAIVMVAVFGVFATLSALDFKMMGVGLSAAVLIDATIVRAFLLPAAMKLLGDWNWYLPKWLQWLPRIEHEAAESVAEPAPAVKPKPEGPRRGPWWPPHLPSRSRATHA